MSNFTLDRRDFVKLGAIAGAGLVIGIRLPVANARSRRAAAPLAPNAFLRVDNAAVDDYFYADSLVFTGMSGETRAQVVVNSTADNCSNCSEWQFIEFDPTSSGPYIELK